MNAGARHPEAGIEARGNADRPPTPVGEQRAAPRLHRQLATRLLVPLLAVVVAVGALGYYTARRQADEVFDRWLLDAAQSLARQVRAGPGGVVSVDLPPAARAILAYDAVDYTFYSVERDGAVLVGVPGLPADGRERAAYRDGRAYDARFAGQPVRVAAVRPDCEGCGGVVVRVAETRIKRERAARALWWFLAPAGVLLAMTAAAVVLAVRQTVRPLERLAAQWNHESHASLRPLHDNRLPGELVPFADALNDLLARIRAMLARERQFAAVAAHQLRTPLTALGLGLDRARSMDDPAQVRALLVELEARTQHIGRLIQQLLFLGRLDPEARAGTDACPLELGALAQDVCAVLADLAAARDVAMELDEPPVPVTVVGQRDLLAEALANLLDNALRASPPHGRVKVAVLDAPPRLRVSDEGPGIAPAQASRLFERFARGAAPAWPGSGLGLAIVRDIAALHGASVALLPPAAAGATFEIRFPANAAPVAPVAPGAIDTDDAAGPVPGAR